MIEVDIGKIIKNTLNSDETTNGVIHEFTGMALNNMWNHWKGKRSLEEQIKPTKDMALRIGDLLKRSHTFGKLHEILSEDKQVWNRYLDVRRNHFVSYLSEAAMHYALGKDWRLVYQFNDSTFRGHQPDGYLGSYSYDVKTRTKNREGLAVYNQNLKDYFYVLAHYFRKMIYLVGYASKSELYGHGRSSSGSFWMPVHKLHPIENFVSGAVASLNIYIGKEQLGVTRHLP